MAAQKELVESGNPKPKPSEITTALEHDWSNLDGAEKKRLEDTKTAELEQWKQSRAGPGKNKRPADTAEPATDTSPEPRPKKQQRSENVTPTNAITGAERPSAAPRKAKQPPQPQSSSTPTAPAKAFPAKINNQPDQPVSRSAPCTACGGDVGSDQLTHPNLPGSLLCDECHERVSRPFKRDEEGVETCCRWCGYGGELVLCDEAGCPSTFCKGCISRNIGVQELSELEKTKDNWACLRCNPSQVQSKKLVFSRPSTAQATRPDPDKDNDMFEEESGEDESEEDESEEDESEEEYESEEEEEDSEEEDAMDQDTHQSVPEMPKLGVGVSLDAKDSRGHWYRAKIVSMDESHVRGASHAPLSLGTMISLMASSARQCTIMAGTNPTTKTYPGCTSTNGSRRTGHGLRPRKLQSQESDPARVTRRPVTLSVTTAEAATPPTTAAVTLTTTEAVTLTQRPRVPSRSGLRWRVSLCETSRATRMAKWFSARSARTNRPTKRPASGRPS